TGRAELTGESITQVATQDLEAIAANKKMIKKLIERVLVTGFQPSADTVATLIGREPSRPPRHDAKNTAESRTARAVDPIFSKPYEPGSSPSSPAPAQKPEATQSKRKQPQVAALLGGLKRA